MFDFSWSEIALVGGVALVLIGPKDLPIAMRTVAGVVKKARSMASEFQGHVDEMLREADLTEARDTLRQMRRLDVRGKVMGLLDEDGSLRRSVREATTPPPAFSAAAPPLLGSTAAPPPEAPAPAFTPGPFDATASERLGPAPDAIPPRIAADILRRSAPRPDFLPPDPAGYIPGRHAY
ncbi:sec-independent protein translocase protein TatB [Endobacter medicaginis]|uniref:Sec-independent protein translocase protein TatB n=4 Tax=Endobacter medicaginis TaxID=1181271 RepID=A0A839UXH9_9PROT|nr:Sec-independent protein translocase protein TatB [Endobacter medicaginis]MBB3173355.1 sec-independent protein translocase protein TatB [Endobacter medicaginis]